tara:strand:+ start:3395 stop:4342 length:948 start_codon:yes stop_codon:yes gene_type:complete
MEYKKKKVSVVLPVYNEEGIIEHLYERLSKMANQRSERYEFLFVNDGSMDGSLNKLLDIRKKDKRVNIIDLSRNYGHHSAVFAGCSMADGDAVVLMDADMEDLPEDIPLFLEKWEEGYQVVYAVRKSRKVSFRMASFFYLFHKLNSIISNVPMQAAGIFCLMDRKVVEKIKLITEHNLYIPGLRSWIGFNQIGVAVNRGARYDSKSRVSLWKLYKLAINNFTSFSDVILSIPLFIGIILCFLSLLVIVVISIFQLAYGIAPWGWSSLVSIVLAIGGLQFAFIGIIGEYITRILIETKNRPSYIIKDKYCESDENN